MSTQTFGQTLLTPTSPVALTWKVVEHETPYTLQYRDGVPYIFGPAHVMDPAGHIPSPSSRHRLPHVEKSHWWKLAGLGVIVSLVTLILLLPIAFATTTVESPAKSPAAIAGIAAELDQRASQQNSTSVVLVNDEERLIVAYQDAQAYSTVSTVAAMRKDSVVSSNSDGSLIYYSKAEPDHVYMAYPNLFY
jgi:hypothetical protein